MFKIYLAAPFFNEKELENAKIAEDMLEKTNNIVFSPRKNQLEQYRFGSPEWRTNAFRSDITHIKWCDYVFALIGDNYDDTGTSMEVGYAYAIGKPILVFNPTKKGLNLMISDGLHAYFEDWQEVLNYDFENIPIKPYPYEKAVV